MNSISRRADVAEWMLCYGRYSEHDVLPMGPGMVERLLMDIMLRDAISRPARDPEPYMVPAKACVEAWEAWIEGILEAVE